jgi:hypothetical protein
MVRMHALIAGRRILQSFGGVSLAYLRLKVMTRRDMSFSAGPGACAGETCNERGRQLPITAHGNLNRFFSYFNCLRIFSWGPYPI